MKKKKEKRKRKVKLCDSLDIKQKLTSSRIIQVIARVARSIIGLWLLKMEIGVITYLFQSAHLHTSIDRH